MLIDYQYLIINVISQYQPIHNKLRKCVIIYNVVYSSTSLTLLSTEPPPFPGAGLSVGRVCSWHRYLHRNRFGTRIPSIAVIFWPVDSLAFLHDRREMIQNRCMVTVKNFPNRDAA